MQQEYYGLQHRFCPGIDRESKSIALSCSLTPGEKRTTPDVDQDAGGVIMLVDKAPRRARAVARLEQRNPFASDVDRVAVLFKRGQTRGAGTSAATDRRTKETSQDSLTRLFTVVHVHT